VLRDGLLQQFDTPQVLFRKPINLFVASFIGSPAMNFIAASIAGGRVQFAGLRLPLSVDAPFARNDRQVIVGIRPTAFTPVGGGSSATLTGLAAFVEELGDERYIIFDIDAPPPDSPATRAAAIAGSAEDTLLGQGQSRTRFMIRLPADVPVAIGEPLSVSFDPNRLHFFDPESGVALH
jgi:multiple sugar transport system ATP-binding protein